MKPYATVLQGLAFALILGPVLADEPAASDPAAALASGKLVIHYHRFDGNYDTPGLWTWDGRKQKEPTSPEVLSSGKTDYGAWFAVDLAEFGNDDGPEERIGFIPRLRRDWNMKDGSDRYWTPELGREVWLIGNDPRIYTVRPDTSPKIDQAYVDSARQVTLVLSTALPAAEAKPGTFTVTDSDKKNYPVSAVQLVSAKDGASKLVEVSLAEDLDFLSQTVTVSSEAYRPADAVLRRVLDDKSRFFSSEPMGAVYTPEATTFRLFSPTTREVRLVLYDNATGKDGRKEVPMTRGTNGVWSAEVKGNLEGRHYKYLVTSQRYDTQEINDPNATNTTGDDGNARITNVRALDPPGFRPIKRPDYGKSPTDAIIYQMHVRDFTVLASSGVSADNRGKYLGLTESDTHLPSDEGIKTALAHLKELGVTHVQIQPFHDWDNDEDKPEYNWGYMTAFFNSPEGSLSSDIRSTARIREVKQMVQAIKEAGLGVILDVVYNHTGVQNTFEHSAPGYFLRMRPDGSFWNGSGTGNELRTEAPMARRFVIDSLKYWVDEYGIDGFRFDLMGLIDLETLKQAKTELRALYPEIMFYGEPWAAAGPDGVGVAQIVYKDVLKGTGIAAFNDHFRDALKGSPDGNDPGYIVNGTRRDGVIRGIAGSIDDWTTSPIQSINYADVHDNLILHDKIKYSAPDATEEERAQMQMLSGGILAVSQGIMLVHTGADFLRSKKGEHNSYNAGDEINGVHWELKKQHHDVFEFYKGVIAIRKAHPMFRLGSAEEVRKRVKFMEDQRPNAESIVFTVSGEGLEGETWKESCVLINPTAEPVYFEIPGDDPWNVFVLGDKAGTESLGEQRGSLEVPGRGMAVLGR